MQNYTTDHYGSASAAAAEHRGALRLYALIQDLAGESAHWRGTQNDLARVLDVSDRTVRTWLRALDAAQAIVVLRGTGTKPTTFFPRVSDLDTVAEMLAASSMELPVDPVRNSGPEASPEAGPEIATSGPESGTGSADLPNVAPIQSLHLHRSSSSPLPDPASGLAIPPILPEADPEALSVAGQFFALGIMPTGELLDAFIELPADQRTEVITLCAQYRARTPAYVLNVIDTVRNLSRLRTPATSSPAPTTAAAASIATESDATPRSAHDLQPSGRVVEAEAIPAWARATASPSSGRAWGDRSSRPPHAPERRQGPRDRPRLECGHRRACRHQPGRTRPSRPHPVTPTETGCPCNATT